MNTKSTIDYFDMVCEKWDDILTYMDVTKNDRKYIATVLENTYASLNASGALSNTYIPQMTYIKDMYECCINAGLTVKCMFGPVGEDDGNMFIASCHRSEDGSFEKIINNIANDYSTIYLYVGNVEESYFRFAYTK